MKRPRPLIDHLEFCVRMIGFPGNACWTGSIAGEKVCCVLVVGGSLFVRQRIRWRRGSLSSSVIGSFDPTSCSMRNIPFLNKRQLSSFLLHNASTWAPSRRFTSLGARRFVSYQLRPAPVRHWTPHQCPLTHAHQVNLTTFQMRLLFLQEARHLGAGSSRCMHLLARRLSDVTQRSITAFCREQISHSHQRP
jgi:hypothetical protein